MGYYPRTLMIFRFAYFMFMFCLHLCTCRNCMDVFCPHRSEEGAGFHLTGVTDSFKPLCWCWEPNLCPLPIYQVFLTIAPYFQPESVIHFQAIITLFYKPCFSKKK